MNEPRTHRSSARFALEGVEGIFVAFLVLVTWPISRRWLANWGTTAGERQRSWRGDAFVSPPAQTYTRSVDISAPAQTVWPWLVQFGLGRAGFYSYELLERLAGIPVRNVEVILPACQSLQIGDELKLHPKAPGIPVGALERERHICYREAGAGDDGPAPDPRRSWSMYIESTSPDSCRLFLRSCIEELRERNLAKRVGLAFEPPIDFVMEQRMLRTIRRLAESLEA